MEQALLDDHPGDAEHLKDCPSSGGTIAIEECFGVDQRIPCWDPGGVGKDLFCHSTRTEEVHYRPQTNSGDPGDLHPVDHDWGQDPS